MVELSQLKCKACRSGEPSLSETEIFQLHTQIPRWDVIKVDGMKRLERVFKFKDFAEAINFVDEVAECAKQQNHHPRIIVEYAKVTLHWWTHKVNGLHLNDFIMAAKMDRVSKSFLQS
jgi:4a-hydroxytetrahydrobiopterin dehydratase